MIHQTKYLRFREGLIRITNMRLVFEVDLGNRSWIIKWLVFCSEKYSHTNNEERWSGQNLLFVEGVRERMVTTAVCGDASSDMLEPLTYSCFMLRFGQIDNPPTHQLPVLCKGKLPREATNREGVASWCSSTNNKYPSEEQVNCFYAFRCPCAPVMPIVPRRQSI